MAKDRQIRIDTPDGGSVTINWARGVLTVAQPLPHSVAAAAALDAASALEIANALLTAGSELNRREHDAVVRGAEESLARLRELQHERKESGQ